CVVLAEEAAHRAQHARRITHEVLVAQVRPLVGAQFLAPGPHRVLAERPALGGAEDVARTERRVEIISACVAPVARDEDELRTGEVFQDLLDEEQVVRRLLAPARLVADRARIAFEHRAVDAREAALLQVRHDLVDDGARIDLHSPEGRLQPEDHFLGERAQVGLFGKIAVGIEVGSKARVVPDHFRHGDAGMPAEHCHHQRGPGALGADHDDRAFLRRYCHPFPIRLAVPARYKGLSSSPSHLRNATNSSGDVSRKPAGRLIFFRMARPPSVESSASTAARSLAMRAAVSPGEAMNGMLIWSRLAAMTRPPFFSQLRATPEAEFTTPTSNILFSTDQPMAAWSRIDLTFSFSMLMLLSRSMAFAARHMFEYWSGVTIVLPLTSAMVRRGESFGTMNSVRYGSLALATAT